MKQIQGGGGPANIPSAIPPQEIEMGRNDSPTKQQALKARQPEGNRQ